MLVADHMSRSDGGTKVHGTIPTWDEALALWDNKHGTRHGNMVVTTTKRRRGVDGTYLALGAVSVALVMVAAGSFLSYKDADNSQASMS